MVTVAGAINRESDGPTRTITVRATSADGSFTDQNYTIAINDVDEFNVGPVSDTNAAADAVNENATVGTTVGITAAASDADSTTSAITYSLFDNDGGRFTIDATTGVVTVAGAINRESDGPSRTITVRATSADGSFTDQNYTIAINDVDEFDATSLVDADPSPNSLAENASTGSLTGITAMSVDADATNNTIVYSLDDDAGGRFTIDSTSGVVTVADGSLLDFEAATGHLITVRATSADGSFSIQNLSIALTDVNESAISAVSDSDATTDFVLENSTIGSAVGVTALASDADGTDSVTYSLDDDAGGRFAIDASTGLITVAGAIDREASASYSVIVRATSTDSSSSTRAFTISVGDVDEFNVGAVTDIDAAANSVMENAAIGTPVNLSALATDADATTSTVSYWLIDDDGGRFAIDATTGIVTVAGVINRETDGPTRSITVRALSADGSFTDQVFNVAIQDADEFDVLPIVDTNSATDVVAENAASGTAVGVTAWAVDGDATTNTITYSLDDNAGGRFTIDGATGVVRVADGSLLDYELATSHSITIRATSADGSSITLQKTISLTDVNEAGISAIADSNTATNAVLENSPSATLVGITASASDPDGTDTVTYSLDDDAGGMFTIDPITGVVTVAQAPDRELASSYNITIRATSSDSSSTTRTFTISIEDQDEHDVATISDLDTSINSVNENATVGTSVGLMAFAQDSDATLSSITYSLTDDDGGRFAIDASSGQVVVAGAIDRESDGPGRTIIVRATSQDGSFSEQSFTIAVVNVNESPSATGATFVTNNVQTLNVAGSVLTSRMSDPEGDALSVQLASGPSHGVLLLNSDGSFQYSANSGFVGEDTFTIRAFDGQLSSAPVTISIVVGLPPVNPVDVTSGNGGNATTAGTQSSATTTSAESSATTPASSTSNVTETVTPLGNADQDNSRIAERSMQAQQSADTGQNEIQGVYGLDFASAATSGDRQAITMQLAAIDWNPLTVSGIDRREGDDADAKRMAGRRLSEIPLLAQREVSELERTENQDFSSFAEPAKWTVISTGVVFWAVRLGHVITTFASTASAWVHFDPLTVIQAVKEKTSADDNITEAMFDTKQKRGS